MSPKEDIDKKVEEIKQKAYVFDIEVLPAPDNNFWIKMSKPSNTYVSHIMNIEEAYNFLCGVSRTLNFFK